MPVLFPEAPVCTPEGCACPPTPETPYENWCCCPVTTVESETQPPLTTFPCYYVIQPKCQIIPSSISGLDNDIASQNPCFINGRSYWTYKLFLPCAVPRPGLSHLVIPICEDITEEQIRVFEKVDCCGEFRELFFDDDGTLDISNDFTNHGPAPEFFNWLKIDNEGAFTAGVCVTYLLSIEGNFQIATGPIELFQANTTGIFNCNPETCFRVPGCIPVGNLSVNKTCTTVVNDTNDTATVTFTVVVCNTGPSQITNIIVNDTQTVPAGTDATNVNIISPPTPAGFTAAFNGTITVSNVGFPQTLAPGACFTVQYAVTFKINTPGLKVFTNTAIATGISNGVPVEGTASSTCNATAFQIAVQKCCLSGTNCLVTFRVRVTNVPGSTATSASITDQVTIPQGITVQFPSANYVGCNLSVPTDTDIVGPAVVTITCPNVPVPSDKLIVIKLVSVSCCAAHVISNAVTAATPNVNTANREISLPTQGLPATAAANVQCCSTCQEGSVCEV